MSFQLFLRINKIGPLLFEKIWSLNFNFDKFCSKSRISELEWDWKHSRLTQRLHFFHMRWICSHDSVNSISTGTCVNIYFCDQKNSGKFWHVVILSSLVDISWNSTKSRYFAGFWVLSKRVFMVSPVWFCTKNTNLPLKNEKKC